MNTSSPPTDSPSAGGRGSENRVTHDQSLNTDAKATEDGHAQPRNEPQLPHDIDESAHSQQNASATQAGVGEQAYADAIGPQQDTDKAPILDRLYNGTIATDRGETPPRQ